MDELYAFLAEIHRCPAPFEVMTVRDLWDDEHISEQMLRFHLDPESAPASRPHSFIDRSAAWIAERFRLSEGPRVGDFGCGPGLYATRFAEAGAKVAGIDFSRRSIAHAESVARERGLDIEYVLADYLTYRSDRPFDLITLIYCDLCPLGPEDRHRLLTCLRDQLAEGGSILLDVSSMSAFEAREETSQHEYRLMDGFWAPGDYFGFLRTFKYEEAAVILDRYTIVEPDRVRRIFNWLQYFSPESLGEELKRAGLRIRDRYSDVAGAPCAEGDVFAVVATKA